MKDWNEFEVLLDAEWGGGSDKKVRRALARNKEPTALLQSRGCLACLASSCLHHQLHAVGAMSLRPQPIPIFHACITLTALLLTKKEKISSNQLQVLLVEMKVKNLS